MIAKHHEGRWTKLVINWNPGTSTKQKGESEARKTRREMRRRIQRIPATNQNQQRQPRSHERHDLAHHGTRWLQMGLRGKSSRVTQPIRPTTSITTTTTTQPTTHEHTTFTTKAHDQDDGGTTTTTKKRRRYTTHSLPHNRHLRNTKATTANKPTKKLRPGFFTTRSF